MHALFIGRVLLSSDTRFHVNPSIGSRVLLFGPVTKPLVAFCSCLSKALDTALANPGCRELGVLKSATRGKQFFITHLPNP